MDRSTFGDSEFILSIIHVSILLLYQLSRASISKHGEQEVRRVHSVLVVNSPFLHTLTYLFFHAGLMHYLQIMSVIRLKPMEGLLQPQNTGKKAIDISTVLKPTS